jgi:hypothetical protein
MSHDGEDDGTQVNGRRQRSIDCPAPYNLYGAGLFYAPRGKILKIVLDFGLGV